MGLFMLVVLLNRFLFIFYNKNIYEIKKNLREIQDHFLVIEAY